jgi:CMP-N,N'-diacetyllegionaminic acid synthase
MMSELSPSLAVIPARGGSKGLPGKNTMLLAGLPLLVHSLRLARMCPEIDDVVVSTEDASIARVAGAHGHPPPFTRPAELAGDATPMWPVLRHALETMERTTGQEYRSLVLLDPTSPSRLPGDVAAAFRDLAASPEADGIVAASEPDFNPLWVCVVNRDGWMEAAFPEHTAARRRQDVTPLLRINGLLYLWRAGFVRRESATWRKGRHLLLVVPESRALSIDTKDEFERAELLVRNGVIRFPWLS